MHVIAAECWKEARYNFELKISAHIFPVHVRYGFGGEVSLASSIYAVRMHSTQKCIRCRKKTTQALV